MIKAFGYVRVSGKGQMEGDGPVRQELAIKHYARTAGIRLAKVFQESVSGTNEGEDRPVWVEMIAAILANGVDTVIVESLGRLARDLMVQEYILSDLQRRGITLISTQEPDLGGDDPTRVLLRQIVGAIAQYDR